MNKDADLSRNINKDSIIYQHEQSMRSELIYTHDEKAILKFIADRLIDITTELRLINHTKL